MAPQNIPSGLARVLSAADQINPVTPQGGLSVAASVLSQASQAGIAANLRAALPSVEQNAQDDQARQMLEAANRASQPAGIAGLDISMGQYAEGGVVGFAYGGGAEFDTGVADEYQLAQDEERIRRLIEERKQRDQTFMEDRAKATAKATGQTYTPPVEPLRFDLGGDAASKINQLVTILRNDPSLSEAARTAIAKEIQNQYAQLGKEPPESPAVASAKTAAPTGIAGLGMDNMNAVASAVRMLRDSILPSTDTSQYAVELGEYKKLLAERPDFLTPAIENISAAEAAALRRAEREEAVRKKNYDPLGALLQGFARNASLAGGPAALRTAEEAYDKSGLDIEAKRDVANELKRNAILAAQRADYNDKIGNTKAALDARKEYETIVERLKSLEATTGSAAMQAVGSMYGADQRADSAMLRAGLGALGQVKPPPDLDATQMKGFREMAKEDIPDLNPMQSPYFIKYLKEYEPELLEKLQSTKWFVNKPKPEELLPIVRAAQENRYRELIAASKFGSAAINRAVPYNVADAELSGATR
jgi:hypothetical protein